MNIHTSITTLQSMGFDVRYPSRAIDHIKTITHTWNRHQFIQMIDMLLDIESTDCVKDLDDTQTQFVLFYVVQNLLTLNKQGILDAEKVYENIILTSSIDSAVNLCKMHYKLIYDVCDDNVTTTASKGTKKERAYALYVDLSQKIEDAKQLKGQMISALIEQLDMTNTGATTYYYMCKKEFNQA